MNDQRWFNLAAALIAVAVTVGALAVVALAPAPATPTPSAAPNPSIPTTYRTLTITLDPASGQYNYNVRSLSVPLHERVVFTITNYDPATARLPTPSDAQVTGTYGGPMTLQSPAGASQVAQLPAGDVSHTFSMSDAYYALNVPIPPAANAVTPSQVTFAVVFDTPGVYTWGCVVLCFDAGMGTADSMYGSMTVG